VCSAAEISVDLVDVFLADFRLGFVVFEVDFPFFVVFEVVFFVVGLEDPDIPETFKSLDLPSLFFGTIKKIHA